MCQQSLQKRSGMCFLLTTHAYCRMCRVTSADNKHTSTQKALRQSEKQKLSGIKRNKAKQINKQTMKKAFGNESNIVTLFYSFLHDKQLSLMKIAKCMQIYTNVFGIKLCSDID